MKQKKKSDVAVPLDYAGNHKGLTFLGLALSSISVKFSVSQSFVLSSMFIVNAVLANFVFFLIVNAFFCVASGFSI